MTKASGGGAYRQKEKWESDRQRAHTRSGMRALTWTYVYKTVRVRADRSYEGVSELASNEWDDGRVRVYVSECVRERVMRVRATGDGYEKKIK